MAAEWPIIVLFQMKRNMFGELISNVLKLILLRPLIYLFLYIFCFTRFLFLFFIVVFDVCMVSVLFTSVYSYGIKVI